MRAPWLVFAALAFLATHSEGVPARDSPQSIVKLCMSVQGLLDESPAMALCSGYIGGFIDGQSTAFAVSNGSPKLDEIERARGYCLRPTVSNGQLVLVFKQYLSNHPEKLDQWAAQLLYDALHQNFPCK